MSKIENFDVFQLQIFCLHGAGLPWVKFVSPNRLGYGLDLTEIIKAVQSYLLCSNPESKVFTKTLLNTDSLEDVENFAGTALEPGYLPWSYVDFSDKNQFLKEIVTSYKNIRAANASIEECLDKSGPNAVCFQSSERGQPPQFDVGKVRSSGSVASLVKKTRSTRSGCVAGTSRDWNSVAVDVSL